VPINVATPLYYFSPPIISPGATPGREVDGRNEQDIVSLRPDGNEMTPEEWNAGWVVLHRPPPERPHAG
jgi:hypothetical protein